MQIEEMERLILLMRDSQVRELTLTQGTARITVRKPVVATVSEQIYETDWQTEAEIVPDEDEFEEMPLEPETVTVTAGIVGFFHHVKPMVGVGAEVKANSKLGVIEAMKLISDLKAPISGVVVDLLIEDGMPVEYGQPLYVLKPSG